MKVIKIEYYEDDNMTFELFDNINKAFDFFNKICVDKVSGKISLVEVNENNIYYEKDGSLNYEDNIELFGGVE